VRDYDARDHPDVFNSLTCALPRCVEAEHQYSNFARSRERHESVDRHATREYLTGCREKARIEGRRRLKHESIRKSTTHLESHSPI
jgi:hypothetical protein